jgi:hypothetical protein
LTKEETASMPCITKMASKPPNTTNYNREKFTSFQKVKLPYQLAMRLKTSKLYSTGNLKSNSKIMFLFIPFPLKNLPHSSKYLIRVNILISLVYWSVVKPYLLLTAPSQS